MLHHCSSHGSHQITAKEAKFSFRVFLFQCSHQVGSMQIARCLANNQIIFPNTQEIKGVRICEQAKGHWSGEWQACPRRDDANFYWLTGEFIDHEPENEKNDHWALAYGY